MRLSDIERFNTIKHKNYHTLQKFGFPTYNFMNIDKEQGQRNKN